LHEAAPPLVVGQGKYTLKLNKPIKAVPKPPIFAKSSTISLTLKTPPPTQSEETDNLQCSPNHQAACARAVTDCTIKPVIDASALEPPPGDFSKPVSKMRPETVQLLRSALEEKRREEAAQRRKVDEKCLDKCVAQTKQTQSNLNRATLNNTVKTEPDAALEDSTSAASAQPATMFIDSAARERLKRKARGALDAKLDLDRHMARRQALQKQFEAVESLRDRKRAEAEKLGEKLAALSQEEHRRTEDFVSKFMDNLDLWLSDAPSESPGM